MFTWNREARPAARGRGGGGGRGGEAADSPVAWADLQRQQRLATELLRVHALSTALAYEPHAPLRVDAAHWWRELRQQSVAAVRLRTSRKRRLRGGSGGGAKPTPTALAAAAAEPAVETETETDAATQQLTKDVLVETLIKILQSLSAWTKRKRQQQQQQASATEDTVIDHVLAAVETAIGDAGVKLLDEWWRALLEGVENDDGDVAATQCGVAVVNVLLQFFDKVGSFHAFHDHKLCASAAQRLFRTQPKWSCSKCARAWETHGAAVPVLVFRCAACEFTLCRECFTRIPNSTVELQQILIAREPFRPPEPLQLQRFVATVVGRAADHDPPLFAAIAPKLATAARARLQEVLLHRSDEMVPMLRLVVDLFSIPQFPRLLVEREPQLWMPMYISSAKMRLYSFLGPLMSWTSMSDEPGEINLTPEGRRDAASTALTLQWVDGYRALRALLAQLFALLLDDATQDPLVVDATLSYLATAVAVFSSTRDSGQNTDDLYDGVLINMSVALVHVVLPFLSPTASPAPRDRLETIYHESFVPRRVYLHRPEPLRKKADQNDRALRDADDRRMQAVDAAQLAQRQRGGAPSPADRIYYQPSDKHFGVLCDFCSGADFVGARYKCAVCDDADVCASCFAEFCTRPVADPHADGSDTAASQELGDAYHCTDHLFLRVDVPVPLIAVGYYVPIEFDKPAVRYAPAALGLGEDAVDTPEAVAQEVACAECATLLDAFDVYFKCSNCLEPRFVCPACLAHEERHHDPREAHLPGHLYLAISRAWRQRFNPRHRGLYSRGLIYPACVYPRERLNTETELFYLTVQALHIGPVHSLAKLLATVKEMHELRAFCACEEQRVAFERSRIHASSSRREPKLSAHHQASQARLADLGATRLMAELHLLDVANVVDWLTFYSRACRWLLEIASPSQNAFKTLLTQFSSAFSSFPEYFFVDLCDMVHVLSLDGTSSSIGGGGRGLDFQSAAAFSDGELNVLEPLLVMLVQLLATRKCTKNPHLRVQAAKALSSLLAFYAKTPALVGVVRRAFQRCAVLRDSAVRAVLQFHEDMEGYHLRNNGLVFNNNAASGDHLLWGFLSIRVATALLLRFLWQFGDQHVELVRAFQARSRTRPSQAADPDADVDVGVDVGVDVDVGAESRVANQVSMLLTGLWSDAAKLLEEGNGKVGVLTQLADIRAALLEGRPIQLPFRPSMLEGYIVLHAKHLRISMRLLVEVLELLSWVADHAQLKRALLKPELADQCARTTSFLIASLAASHKAGALEFTWHHAQDAKRLLAHLVILVARCAALAPEKGGASGSPSPFWSLAQESGASMLRFIGDIDAHNRWALNRAIVRLESARHLGEDTGGQLDRVSSSSSTMGWAKPSVRKGDERDENCDEQHGGGDGSGDDDDELDENDALALLEQQSAAALTTITSHAAVARVSAAAAASPHGGAKGKRALARQLGSRFVSALAKDGRFDAEAFLAGRELLRRRPGGCADDRDYEYVGVAWMALYEDVLRRCQDMVKLQTAMDELLSDIPEEFLDPLLSTIMTDPVRLPSGNVVDRSVIERHLLSANRVDPFTREPLTPQMLAPCDALRREIQRYLRSKLQHLTHQQDDVLATWGLAWDCIFDVSTHHEHKLGG